MKLLKIISQINQVEISKFYNLLTNIITSLPENKGEPLDKKADADGFVKTFNRAEVYTEYESQISKALRKDFLLDIIADVVIRDGNCIMSKRWCEDLVNKELSDIEVRINEFKAIFAGENSDIDDNRKRDYQIYYNCVHTALYNDEENNLEAKITSDELSILYTLKDGLGLSNEEARSIYFSVVDFQEIKQMSVDTFISMIKDSGIGFYRRTSETVYIPDEIISLLRDIKRIKLPNKHTRRILKCFDDKMINKIKKIHRIRAVDRHEKIVEIINQGIDINQILSTEIFEPSTNANDKKKILNEIIEDKLEIHLSSAGRTINEKIDNLVSYFLDSDKDEKGGISKDGYDRLLQDLSVNIPDFGDSVRNEFEIEDKVELKADVLLDYNIKPRDVLYILSMDVLKQFCKDKEISLRSKTASKNVVNNIMSNYKDTENEFIENYVFIANNDVNALKNSGVMIKADMIGSTFETVTKKILENIGFTVNEELRQEVNTNKDKADIVLDLGNNEVIIIECKSSKNSYNKFSTVSRQIGAYNKLYERAGKIVRGSILISGEFTDDMVQECELFSDFNITLIEANTLINVYDEFKSMKKKNIPVPLFTRAGLMKEDIVIPAMKRGR